MGTIIIGASGKKQSGKSTLCDGCFDRLSLEGVHTKIYSFADMLKEKICMDVMGLTAEQCYGTDEEKNSLTNYKWGKLPHDIRVNYASRAQWEWKEHSNHITGQCPYIYKEGYITAREIMQVVGTNIFRKYFDDKIWVNATFCNIEKENPKLAFISDVRFPSEVEGIMKKGGYIIRLLRDVCKEDSHESESALDNYNWEQWGDRIYLLDNQNMSIKERNDATFKYMDGIINE